MRALQIFSNQCTLHRVPRKLKSGKKLLATDPFSEKSPRIHQITPKLGCYLENSWVFANARARSGDSAPRGQGGGSPPCTSCLLCLQKLCLLCLQKLSPEANYFPPLGTLCSGTSDHGQALCTHLSASLQQTPYSKLQVSVLMRILILLESVQSLQQTSAPRSLFAQHVLVQQSTQPE